MATLFRVFLLISGFLLVVTFVLLGRGFSRTVDVGVAVNWVTVVWERLVSFVGSNMGVFSLFSVCTLVLVLFWLFLSQRF